jgi:Zn-dependent protease with chaperone function
MVFVIIISLLGVAIGYRWGSELSGLVIAILISVIYCLICTSQGKKMIMSMAHATKIEKGDNPFLWNTVEGLSISAGVPMPDIYIIDTDIPNAFATGYRQTDAAIAVTSGILERLNREELEGVIAHEMSHIRNHDIRSATIAIALGGIIVLMGRLFFRSGFRGGYGRRRGRDNRGDGDLGAIVLVISLIVAILSPIITALIQSAISRQREYQADATAAAITGYPEGLASALEKISQVEIDKSHCDELGGKELMGLYISNPFAEANNWFATHPPTEERIRRLRNM